ncbi:MAG TPA: hypothetical protein VM121_11580 [Acidimicrobiales bacterium]|nr:hypothetical protein [Acidimicrobiales bacterium]
MAATLVVIPSAGAARAAVSGELTLASHVPTSAVTTGNERVQPPAISADGTIEVFTSYATNLVPGQIDTNGERDIFLLERATGAMALVSHAPGISATTANGLSSFPAISADGRFVAFSSFATNLVAGQMDSNGGSDTFLFDRSTGGITLVSHVPGANTTTGNQGSWPGSVSANGAVVTVNSSATNLVTGQIDTNGTGDVFLFEVATGSTTLVSHASDGVATTGNKSSEVTSVSADGQSVAIKSHATNLVAGQSDTNNGFDVFLFDRATSSLQLVSHIAGSATSAANRGSEAPRISADGGSISFMSLATNVVGGQSDSNHVSTYGFDSFLFDRATGTVTLVSHIPGSTTETANLDSFSGSLSASGAFVLFNSNASNLVSGQTDSGNTIDTFLFERATGSVTLVSHTATSATATPSSSTGAGASGGSFISSDGGFVAFASSGVNHVGGQIDINGGRDDIFLFHRATGLITLVSHIPSSAVTTGNGYSPDLAMSTDGAVVAFTSFATDLVVGQSDANGVEDLFLFQRMADAASPPPADFDGNGRTDLSVFRPSNGVWFVKGGLQTPWGTSGDVPVTGDYDGDGDSEVAVYRPSTGVWYVKGVSQVQLDPSVQSIPVPGDYDGDGDTDYALFRPSDGMWTVNGTPVARFGTSGDIPVPGDYDNDGDADLAVFRPSNGVWYVSGGAMTSWGADGDIPVPGDYDNDGDADFAVFRPSNGVWYVKSGATTAWGTAGDIPVPGDYDGDGDSDVAVFRPANGVWYIQGGAAVGWGTSGDVPLPLPDAIRRFFFPAL